MLSVMQMPRLEYVVWIGSLGLGLCNIVMMVRRGLLGRFSWFFSYLLVSAGYGTVLCLLTPHLSRRAYGEAGWIQQLALLVMSMLLVYSFWRDGLAKYQGLHRLCIALLAFAVVVGLVVVTFTTRSGPGIVSTPANWINNWLILFYRSTMFVVTGLLWVFLGFLSFFRIQVSRTIRDLALGLFFYGLVRVGTDSYNYFHGASTGSGQDYVKLVAAFLMQLLWCVTIVRHREDEPVETVPRLALKGSPEDLDRQIDAINLVLLRLTGSAARDSGGDPSIRRH